MSIYSKLQPLRSFGIPTDSFDPSITSLNRDSSTEHLSLEAAARFNTRIRILPSLRTGRRNTPHPNFPMMDGAIDPDTPINTIGNQDVVTSSTMDANIDSSHGQETARNTMEASPLTQLLALHTEPAHEEASEAAPTVEHTVSIAPSTSAASSTNSRSSHSFKRARLRILETSHPSVKLIVRHIEARYHPSPSNPDPPPFPLWVNLGETAQQLERFPNNDATRSWRLPLCRSTREAPALIKAWRSNHPTWREAFNANQRLPHIATRSEIFALEVLNKEGRGVPGSIKSLYEDPEVDLGWIFDHGYVEPRRDDDVTGWEQVPAFWRGAGLFDADWRGWYMKGVKGNVPQLEFADDLTDLVKSFYCRSGGRGVAEEDLEELEEENKEEKKKEKHAKREQAAMEKDQMREGRSRNEQTGQPPQRKLKGKTTQSEKLVEKGGEGSTGASVHQQLSSEQQPANKEVNCAPMLQELMEKAVKNVLLDVGPSILGKRRLEEDDDDLATAADKKQKTMPQKEVEATPGARSERSQTRPTKARESATTTTHKKEDNKEENKLEELVKKHNAVVKQAIKLEAENEKLQDQVNGLTVKYEAMEQRQKLLLEGHEAMAARVASLEEEKKTLGNQIAACFRRLELVEKGHYHRPAQAAQTQPKQPPQTGQQAQARRGGSSSAGSGLFIGKTFSRPSV